jgi:hypothetical protein
MRQKTIILVSMLLVIAVMACSLTFNLNDTPQPATTIPNTPILVQTQLITVYFTDQNRFVQGTEPYEVAVTREVPISLEPMRAILDAFFTGPTAEETDQGLILVSSGFTGVRDLTIQNGIARLYLDGKCANNGAAYSVANLIKKNLSQFPQINAVKIFDENGSNLDPDSPNSSLPYCLEP